jgi:hypothetical protein
MASHMVALALLVMRSGRLRWSTCTCHITGAEFTALITAKGRSTCARVHFVGAITLFRAADSRPREKELGRSERPPADRCIRAPRRRRANENVPVAPVAPPPAVSAITLPARSWMKCVVPEGVMLAMRTRRQRLLDHMLQYTLQSRSLLSQQHTRHQCIAPSASASEA